MKADFRFLVGLFALVGGLVGGKAVEPAEPDPVVESFSKLQIGQAVPDGQQQVLDQGQRWPSGSPFSRSANQGKLPIDLNLADEVGNLI